MSSPPVTEELSELPSRLREAYAPLRKGALGVALGAVLGGALFLVTAYHLVLEPGVPEHIEAHAFDGDPVGHLWLLEQYFPGYGPASWSGALAGLAWGFAVGFVLGFAVAALRNGVIGLWLFVVRAKGNLRESQRFLDQI